MQIAGAWPRAGWRAAEAAGAGEMSRHNRLPMATWAAACGARSSEKDAFNYRRCRIATKGAA